MSEWTLTTLGDVLRVEHGFAFKGEHFSMESGDVLLTPKNFGPSGGLEVSAHRCKYYAGSVEERFVLHVGDIVMAMTDLKQDAPILGSTGVVPAGRRYLHNQRIGKIVISDPDRLDRRFAPWLLNSPSVRRGLRATATGATVRHTAPSRVAAIRVLLPDRTLQARIAAVLSAFDDLIQINERRIELLEDLARSLYREWFVDFRFPGHEDVRICDSELGPLPQGWKAKRLFDVADVAFGYPFKSRHFSDSGMYPVIRIRDVPRGTTDTFTNEESDLRYQVSDGDVLIGMDGTFYVRQWSGGTAWLNQRVARLRPVGDLGGCHLMHAVRGPVMQLNGSIVGTTVAHLGKRHLQEVRLAVPSRPIREAATALFDAIGSKQIFCEQQNRALAATRDLLLPRLVSGQLDVSDIDLGPLAPAETE